MRLTRLVKKIKSIVGYKKSGTRSQYSEAGHPCPVCEKYIFEEYGSFDICPVCGWEDDNVQYEDRDFAGGANRLSANESRRLYLLKTGLSTDNSVNKKSKTERID